MDPSKASVMDTFEHFFFIIHTICVSTRILTNTQKVCFPEE